MFYHPELSNGFSHGTTFQFSVMSEMDLTNLGLSWPVFESTSVHSSMVSIPSLLTSASLKASSYGRGDSIDRVSQVFLSRCMVECRKKSQTSLIRRPTFSKAPL